MREIKFRAWEEEYKCMYYNHSVSLTISGEVSFCNRSGEWEPVQENQLILMQYIGDKAKSNNQDVYEGDVCIATFKTKEGVLNITGKIVMDEFMWCLETTNETYSLNRVTIIDVIGNIYENPNLLA